MSGRRELLLTLHTGSFTTDSALDRTRVGGSLSKGTPSPLTLPVFKNGLVLG